MNTKEYSFNASILNGKKIIKGVLSLSIQGYAFTESSYEKETEKVDWRKIKYSTGIIDVPIFVFFSSKRKYIELKNENKKSRKFIVKEIDITSIEKIISNFSKMLEEEYICQEAERKRQEELARQEAERKRQEELARQEAERKRQEELARQEAERKRQEELARQEAERKRQEELARQEAERKRQEELARQEAERRRQEELARQEAERKHQEELARQEAERKRQEELARQEAERRRQEEVARQEAERKRQEELARQEAERKRQEELARQEAERKRQEELARQEEEQRRQEELARQEAERKHQEELARQEEKKNQQVSSIIGSIKQEKSNNVLHHPIYESMGNYIDDNILGRGNARLEILASHVMDLLWLLIEYKNGEEISTELIEEYDSFMVVVDHSGIGKGYLNVLQNIFTDIVNEQQVNLRLINKTLQGILAEQRVLIKAVELYDNDTDYNIDYRHLNVDFIYSADYVDTNDINDLLREVAREQKRITFEERKKEKLRRVISEIHEYIVQQRRPVTREQLKRHFVNYSKKALDGVLVKGDILDYRNKYFALKNIRFEENEIWRWKRDIISVIRKNDNICHSQEIFDEHRYLYNDIFQRAYIDEAGQLFSLIKGLYGDEFSFMRPYIALSDEYMVDPETRIRERIIESDEIKVDDIIDFSKEIHYKITNILEFLLSADENMLLKNREHLISLEKAGITKGIAEKVERLIFEEILYGSSCVAIRDLKCIPQLPIISIPWDEWLIYSTLKKYGNRVHLHTTSNQFRFSIPVVSLNGCVDEHELEDIASKHAGNISSIMSNKVADLTDLDSLIEDYIDLDDIDDLDEFDDLDLDEFDNLDDLEEL